MAVESILNNHKTALPPELLQKSCPNIVVRGSWIAHQHEARTCSYNWISNISFIEVLLKVLGAKFHFQKLYSPNFPYQCISFFFCNVSVPVAFLLNTDMNLLSKIRGPKCFLLLYLQHGCKRLLVTGQRCCKAAVQLLPSHMEVWFVPVPQAAAAFCGGGHKAFHQFQTII